MNIPLGEWSGSDATDRLRDTIVALDQSSAKQTRTMVRLTWAIAALTVVLVGGLAYQIFLQSRPADRWSGYAYPARNAPIVQRETGSYSSLADCRAASQAYLRGIGATYTGDYECGKNCSATGGLSVCEVTSR